jgi:hypothetical protein
MESKKKTYFKMLHKKLFKNSIKLGSDAIWFNLRRAQLKKYHHAVVMAHYVVQLEKKQ